MLPIKENQLLHVLTSCCQVTKLPFFLLWKDKKKTRSTGTTEAQLSKSSKFPTIKNSFVIKF